MSFTSPVSDQEALPHRLDKVLFGLLSPSEIRKIGFIEIREPTAYDEGGLPVPGGVLDPRLGTMNPRQRCPTCGNFQNQCPGHFGRIELARPVIHVGYVKKIKDILNATCSKCGKLLLPEEERQKFIEEAKRYWEEHPEEKINDSLTRTVRAAVKKYLRNHDVCPHCGARVESVDLEEVLKFIVKDPAPRRLRPNEIRDWLERIPDEDAMVLGFNPERARPEWAVLTVILVPPPSVRPSIFLQTGERSEDDLTHMLVEILKANKKLRDSINSGAPNSVVESEWDLLQYWVAVFYRNAMAGLPVAMQRGTRRPLKSLFQRLEGKEGRFRKNLVGKRVDFSSRTVISPDPMIEIDEVGVPVEIAMTLTIPEYVNESNIEWLKELVMRGPDQYPGANYVRKGGGMPISLKVVKARGLLEEIAESLQPGDVVERHLMDGDYVIFNRQPSLHKLSIMGHRVKVLPGSTFRLNPGTCLPYNADFDGDEMNLHAPQLMEARIEARELMSVVKNMLSPRTGGSIVGARQDMITALYLLTKKGAVFDREEASRLLATVGITELPEPAIQSPVELWTGKQLISTLLPPDLEYETTAKLCKEKELCQSPESPIEGYVLVINGKLLAGVLDEGSVGTLVKGKQTIIDVLIRDYGEERAAEFLNKLLRLAAKSILLHGVTVTLNELILPPEAREELEKLFKKAAEEVDRKVAEFEKTRGAKRYMTKEELLRATLEEQMLEFDIVRSLDALRTQATEVIAKYVKPESHAMIMAKTGARGSIANLAQVMGLVGQQTVKSRVGFVLTSGRPKKGFRERALSYFKRGDLRLEARGFVKNGYMVGLNPAEFVFHAMTSRESLVDKGRRTEDSGYFYRRVANSLKDIYVEYDETVRDSLGRIIQFAFGGDGMDPVKLFKGEPVNLKRVVREIVKPGKKRGASKKKLEEIVKKAELPSHLADLLYEANASEKEAREVVREVKRRLEEARVEVLTPIGIISAQSIAEPATQMVLRTFHAPGVLAMDVTHGVERFKELVFYVSTSTPTMTIYLKPEYAKSKEKAEEMAKRLREVRVKDLLKEYRIDNLAFSLELVLDREKMRDSGIDDEELVNFLKKAVKGIKGSVELEGDGIRISMIEAAGREKPYLTLRQWTQRIMEKRIRGIGGIDRVWVEATEEGEFVIKTRGSNLKEVVKLDFVDPTRTITNDCKEIYEVLGVEAARACILNELSRILSEQGLEVDRRYVSLVADAMTYTGKPTPLSLQASGVPSGFFSEMKTPLSKMAYEWVYHVVLNTARRGEDNPIKGPLDALIMGQTPPVGTGRVEVRWDWRRTEELLKEVT